MEPLLERDSRPVAGPSDIVGYLAEFDLTLADLEPRQLAMFVAARNAARFVVELGIPVGRQSTANRSNAVLEQDAERPRPQTAYRGDRQETAVPDNEMNIDLIRDAEELPRICPSQWLLEDVCPTAFYSKLADRELFVPRWERPDDDPDQGDEDTRQWELMDRLAIAQSTRQHAYVLLDISRSMNDRDQRGTVARGLTLAFLLHGMRRQARLHLRPFTVQVDELSSGIGKAELCAIARRLMETSNHGQTRIQPALEQATSDIRNPGACLRADVLLITDGISPLSRNPLVAEKLHTFVLGNADEQEGSSGTVATLQSWSQTFRRIWRPQFSDILMPLSLDIQAASAVLDRALEQMKQGTASYTADELRRMTQNVQALQKELSRQGEAPSLSPAEQDALQDQLHQARQFLKQMPRSPRSKRLRDVPPEARNQAVAAGRGGHGRRDASALWLLLRHWTARLGGWLRRLAGFVRPN